MTTANKNIQFLQTLKTNPNPLPASTIEEETESEVLGKKTYDVDMMEVRPGVMFDRSIIEQMKTEDKQEDVPDKEYNFLGYKVKGPPSEAFFKATPTNALIADKKAKDNFDSRLKEFAKNNNGVIDPIVLETRGPGTSREYKPTETSTLIYDMLGDNALQRLMSFTDNEQEYTNALKNSLGEGNFRIFEDTLKTGFEPKFYVSVKKDDGTFTAYSPVTNTLGEYFNRIGTQVGFETGASLANLAQASALSIGIAQIPGIGIPLSVVSFLYFLYAGGKNIEKGREALKSELKLNDEQAQAMSELFSNFANSYYPQNIAQDDFATEISGILESAGGAVGLKTLAKTIFSDVKQKYIKLAQRTPDTIGSLAKTRDFAETEGLVPFILSQVTDEKIIGRLTSLAEQTSLVIPIRLREQMQSAVTYIKTYKDNIGKGDFLKFKQQVADYGKFVSKAQTTERPDVDYTNIGENILALDELYLLLRGVQSQGMYKNVFDKLKKSSYNLEDLRTILPKNFKTIIPTSPEGVTKTPTTGSLPISEKGETLFRNMVFDVMALGRTNPKDKTRILTPEQVKKAVKDFSEKNPGFEFDIDSVDSPAKILQLYASRFGAMARENFGKGGTAENPQLAKQAMVMRRALEDLIGNPREPIDGIKQELREANDFYKQTFDTTEIIERSKIAQKVDAKGEPSDLTSTILGAPGSKSAGKPATKTLEFINEMETYVKNNINKLGFDVPIPKKDLTELQGAFLEVLRHKIARGLGTKLSEAGSPTDAIAYLDSFETPSIRALGIDEAAEKQLRDDAETIATINNAQFMDAITPTPDDANFKFVFEELLEGKGLDRLRNIDKLVTIANQAVKAGDTQAVENLRSGLLEYLISKESGVIKTVVKKSAYAEKGTDVIDPATFTKVMDMVNENPAFRKILTDEDIRVLNGLENYVGIIQQTGADAGAALAGAQIVGGLFTIDPAKFVSGLTRIVAQRRVSQLVTDKSLVDMVLNLKMGRGDYMNVGQKMFEMMTGKQAFGTILARFALEGIDEKYNVRTPEEQTDDLLSAPQLNNQNIQFLKSLRTN